MPVNQFKSAAVKSVDLRITEFPIYCKKSMRNNGQSLFEVEAIRTHAYLQAYWITIVDIQGIKRDLSIKWQMA